WRKRSRLAAGTIARDSPRVFRSNRGYASTERIFRHGRGCHRLSGRAAQRDAAPTSARSRGKLDARRPLGRPRRASRPDFARGFHLPAIAAIGHRDIGSRQGAVNHEHRNEDGRRAGTARWKWAFAGFLAIAAFFLLTEHRAHVLGWLPFLILLACPL